MRDTTGSKTPAASASEHYLQWKENFKKIVDKYLLVKKLRVRKNNVPYMNVEWKEVIRKKSLQRN